MYPSKVLLVYLAMALTILWLSACGAANRRADHPTSYAVECYSGGVTIFSADVTPDSWMTWGNGGVDWKDAGRQHHIIGDCVVEEL